MYARQEVARLFADALCVREVTRILVGRAKVETSQPLAGTPTRSWSIVRRTAASPDRPKKAVR